MCINICFCRHVFICLQDIFFFEHISSHGWREIYPHVHVAQVSKNMVTVDPVLAAKALSGATWHEERGETVAGRRWWPPSLYRVQQRAFFGAMWWPNALVHEPIQRLGFLVVEDSCI